MRIEDEIKKVPECPCCSGVMCDNQSNEDIENNVDSYVCEKCLIAIDIYSVRHPRVIKYEKIENVEEYHLL